MTRWTITFFLTAVLTSTVARGQTKTDSISPTITKESMFFPPKSYQYSHIKGDTILIDMIPYYERKIYIEDGKLKKVIVYCCDNGCRTTFIYKKKRIRTKSKCKKIWIKNNIWCSHNRQLRNISSLFIGRQSLSHSTVLHFVV